MFRRTVLVMRVWWVFWLAAALLALAVGLAAGDGQLIVIEVVGQFDCGKGC